MKRYLSPPSDQQLLDYRKACEGLECAMIAPGWKEARPRFPWTVLCGRVVIGRSDEDWLAAKAALFNLEMLKLPWLRPSAPSGSLSVGDIVAVAGRLAGMWVATACRVTEVIDERAPKLRAGFTYSTLSNHPLVGAESFCVDYEPGTDRVEFEVASISRPRGVLGFAGIPVLRRVQRRFIRDCCAAMTEACRRR